MSRNGQPNPLRILIVEDNLDTARSLQQLLQLEGYVVRQARTGLEAVALIQAELPDVVLLDIGLPELDGYAVAKLLKQQKGEKSSLVIAVTGHGAEEDRRLSEQAGIDLHLVKPVNPEQLQSVLKRFQSILSW